MKAPLVIYEDEHMVGIVKPSGLVVHPGVGTGETLVDWIEERYPAMVDVGEGGVDSSGKVLRRGGIVHRLDKETSGVMVLAKNQEAYITLKRHFQRGKVLKEYHAFVYGRPSRPRGTIASPIGKSKNDFRKQSVRNIRGEKRETHTEYVLVGACEGGGTSFIKFYPKTGRTHQIRVHAGSIGVPIVGDSLYASKQEFVLGFTRLALHARRVTLSLHWNENPLHIIAPYPDDFTYAMSLCGITSKEG